MGRQRSRIRNLAEFALARSVLAGVQLMPAGLLAPLSRGFGGLLYRVIKSRRGVVRQNVELAFKGSAEAPDPDVLCRASLASLCRSFMEMALLPRSEEDALRLVNMRDSANYRAFLRESEEGPVVIAASHFGAYEILGVMSSLLGHPTTTLVRPLDNPLLDSYLNGIRMRFGQRIVGNRGGLRDLLRDLKSGRNAVVLVDLNHRASQRVFVDYFGTPAATATTAARLALRSGRPMLCVFARRLERPLRFEIDFGKLHHPKPGEPRETETRRLMQLVTRDVEERVRAEPELWLWTHRRWKTRPAQPGGAAE